MLLNCVLWAYYIVLSPSPLRRANYVAHCTIVLHRTLLYFATLDCTVLCYAVLCYTKLYLRTLSGGLHYTMLLVLCCPVTQLCIYNASSSTMSYRTESLKQIVRCVCSPIRQDCAIHVLCFVVFMIWLFHFLYFQFVQAPNFRRCHPHACALASVH